MPFLRPTAATRDPQEQLQACLRRQDYKGALAAFAEILKANPSSTLRMRYADTLVLAGRRGDAVREYLKVADELAAAGYLVKAVAVYKKVVKLDPGRAEVVERLARLDAERSKPAPPPDAASDGGMELD